MAKSIEQKAVDALANTMLDARFRHAEFARLMTEQQPVVHQSFFQLMKSYLRYIAVHTKYNYYPNGIASESIEAEKMLRDSPYTLDDRGVVMVVWGYEGDRYVRESVGRFVRFL